MKKIIITLAAVLTAVATYGQGQVAFNTRVAGSHNAPVTLPGGAPAGSIQNSANLRAQLFLVQGSTLTALTPATVFNTGSANPLLDQYVVPVDVIVPTVAPGAEAVLRFRAWGGDNYETATVFGESNDITITLGGGTLPPANLTGLEGFEMVPEPSTITLGVLGAAALLLRRRK